MITSRIAKDAPKNVDELWESIQRGFWAIPDDSLDNLFHQKTVACAQIWKAARLVCSALSTVLDIVESRLCYRLVQYRTRAYFY